MHKERADVAARRMVGAQAERPAAGLVPRQGLLTRLGRREQPLGLPHSLRVHVGTGTGRHGGGLVEERSHARTRRQLAPDLLGWRDARVGHVGDARPIVDRVARHVELDRAVHFCVVHSRVLKVVGRDQLRRHGKLGVVEVGHHFLGGRAPRSSTNDGRRRAGYELTLERHGGLERLEQLPSPLEHLRQQLARRGSGGSWRCAAHLQREKGADRGASELRPCGKVHVGRPNISWHAEAGAEGGVVGTRQNDDRNVFQLPRGLVLGGSGIRRCKRLGRHAWACKPAVELPTQREHRHRELGDVKALDVRAEQNQGAVGLRRAAVALGEVSGADATKRVATHDDVAGNGAIVALCRRLCNGGLHPLVQREARAG